MVAFTHRRRKTKQGAGPLLIDYLREYRQSMDNNIKVLIVLAVHLFSSSSVNTTAILAWLPAYTWKLVYTWLTFSPGSNTIWVSLPLASPGNSNFPASFVGSIDNV